jgi:hypothetical protein
MRYTNYVFNVVFLIECVLKILGMGLRPYISDHFNKLDATIVTVCADVSNLFRIESKADHADHVIVP